MKDYGLAQFNDLVQIKSTIFGKQTIEKLKGFKFEEDQEGAENLNIDSAS